MDKPSGVLVVAVFYLILAALSILAGMDIVTSAGPLAEAGPIVAWLAHRGPRGLSPEGIAVLKNAVGVFYLALGALEIALAVGLVKVKEWARSLAVVLTTILFMAGTLGLLASFSLHAKPSAVLSRTCLLVLELVALDYLVKPTVRAAFQNVQVQAKSA